MGKRSDLLLLALFLLGLELLSASLDVGLVVEVAKEDNVADFHHQAPPENEFYPF